ncbi:MAG: helicase [Desulfuromonas sp.]|nr:MAG: helicase [Desulfuromonas sp.]
MSHDLHAAAAQLIVDEEQRLDEICVGADAYNSERKQKLGAHKQKLREIEHERLASNNPREIDKLTEEIERLSQYDPAKYLIPFEEIATPYLAGIAIRDDDPAIGRKHILFGKQGLMLGNRVLVTDWRRAEISKLYYEWDEGEEYEEDIGERERSGVIEQKLAYGIVSRELRSLQRGRTAYEKRDGQWCDPQRSNVSALRKEQSGDHRMVDIVALISREQFGLITRNSDGCLYLTGGAGCGKTTVALHRLSYLVFNQPERFRPNRCLVVMFNRSLCNYVKKSSQELLTPELPVETFHSWALRALRGLDLKLRFVPTRDAGLTALKKSVAFFEALREYAARPADSSPLADLGAFYRDGALLRRHCDDPERLESLARQGERLLEPGCEAISFDDAGPLIHLAQLRRAGAEIPGALGWYDHVLIDEAQDLSLVELHALMDATTRRRSLTVCADERQKILEFVDAAGFSAFQLELQGSGLAAGELAISYRSTRPIMTLAAKVAGRALGEVVNDGAKPRLHHYDSQDVALDALRRAVGALLAREHHSLTAIICRFRQEAFVVHEALKGLPGVRLQTADLSFEPGILITTAHQVKGLEFTGVILWNPSERAYPVSEIGQNLLYVAITRACERLAVYHYQPLSPLFSGEQPGWRKTNETLYALR